jgi:hypothetical protein
VCNTLFPVYRTVPIAAGGPIGGEILKCSLKSIDFKSYAVTFTAAEQRRLKAIFPKGVCDYSKARSEAGAPRRHLARLQRLISPPARPCARVSC